MSAPSAIVVRDVTKVHGTRGAAVGALDGVSLSIPRGELCCIVGASGCGKSTLLNLIVGLDQPTSGHIDVTGRSTLMFQESALFPWLTVRGNIELALRLRGVGRRERRRQADDLLATVRLEQFGDKRPHELSGGMRQRVAIARAFAQDADVLLMDEPFGALDAMTRDLLHDELETLWRDRELTIVFVTHDVREAVRLADRIVVLSSRPGRVLSETVVPFDRPRHVEEPDSSELSAEILEQLRDEVRRHAER